MHTATIDCFVSDSQQMPATGNGPLNGLHFATKDIFAIQGHTASFGLPRWRETHPPSTYTAPIIKQLLAAGAGLAGITKLDQLCASLIGNVSEKPLPENPRYPDRFTGGSSSGSAAAVAAGVADFALGSDTSGSIRVPAASCGVYAIRPSIGTVDKTGMLDWAPASDVVGILARDPAILAAAFDVVAAPTGSMPVEHVLLPATKDENLDQEVYDALLQVGQALSSLDYQLDYVDYSAFVDGKVIDSYARIQCRDIWQTAGTWTKPNLHYLAPDVRQRQLIAEALASSPEPDKQADIALCTAYKQYFKRFIGHSTIAILPITPCLPPKRTASATALSHFRRPAFGYCAISSITGCPEVVIPVRHPHSGHTYGVGLLGAPGNDRTLLSLAIQLRKLLIDPS